MTGRFRLYDRSTCLTLGGFATLDAARTARGEIIDTHGWLFATYLMLIDTGSEPRRS